MLFTLSSTESFGQDAKAGKGFDLTEWEVDDFSCVREYFRTFIWNERFITERAETKCFARGADKGDMVISTLVSNHDSVEGDTYVMVPIRDKDESCSQGKYKLTECFVGNTRTKEIQKMVVFVPQFSNDNRSPSSVVLNYLSKFPIGGDVVNILGIQRENEESMSFMINEDTYQGWTHADKAHLEEIKNNFSYHYKKDEVCDTTCPTVEEREKWLFSQRTVIATIVNKNGDKVAWIDGFASISMEVDKCSGEVKCRYKKPESYATRWGGGSTYDYAKIDNLKAEPLFYEDGIIKVKHTWSFDPGRSDLRVKGEPGRTFSHIVTYDFNQPEYWKRPVLGN